MWDKSQKDFPCHLRTKPCERYDACHPKGQTLQACPKQTNMIEVDFFPTRSILGLSTGRSGSGLCPTRTRPNFIGWEKSLTHNRPGQSFGSVGSGRIGFGSVSVGFGFAWVERNLTGFWPKCGRISLDLVRSNKIWPIFSYNYKDRAEILMDLAEICLYRRT